MTSLSLGVLLSSQFSHLGLVSYKGKSEGGSALAASIIRQGWAT